MTSHRLGLPFWMAAWLASASIVSAVGCSEVADVNAVFEQLTAARRLAADLQVEFTKASDAANRAVMADTDDRSVSAVAEARRAFDTLKTDTETLAPILEKLEYADEIKILQQFTGRVAEYRALEENILNLAVENTNLKARRLSFGPAQQAVDAFGTSLGALTTSPSPEAWHVKALAASALAAVREIQVLQSPHIAETNDAVMTGLEKQMTASEATARGALKELRPLVTPAARARVDAAAEALDRFLKTNTELLALSRRNTNVRSLAMSLEQKRTLIAPCEESLGALREALEKRRHVGRRWP